ncbi:MAG TPA: hypothetical protein VFW24_04870, partial [Acidimicrobiales bacterium]|nr:hypothetical protein [Acidimicrobiales bacterium]
VQAAAGIAAGESGGAGRSVTRQRPGDPGDEEQPGALPCQLLDHGTGYLAAAAVLDGLRRQAEGRTGTHVRRLSLARTAAWLVGHPAEDPQRAPVGPPDDDGAGMVSIRQGPDEIRMVAPPGALDGIPLRWPGPPARYGTDAPAWSDG